MALTRDADLLQVSGNGKGGGEWKEDRGTNVSDGHFESQSQCAFNKTIRKGQCTFSSAVGVGTEG